MVLCMVHITYERSWKTERLGEALRRVAGKLIATQRNMAGPARGESVDQPGNGSEIDVAAGHTPGEGIRAGRRDRKAGVEAGEVAHGHGSGDGRKIAIRAGWNLNGRGVWTTAGLATP